MSDQRHSTAQAIFGPNGSTELLGLLPHCGIAHGAMDGFGQSPGCQLLQRNGIWSHAKRPDPRAPKGLVDDEGHNQRWDPGAQRFRRRAGTTMVDHSRHTRKEPGMWHGVQYKNVGRKTSGAQTAPSRRQHATSATLCQCVQDEIGHLFGMAAGHAAKPNVHRWITCFEERL